MVKPSPVFDRRSGWWSLKDRGQPKEPTMNLSQKLPSVAEILQKHVTLELEGIDRMYLNVYVSKLQCESGTASFFRYHLGYPVVSSVLMASITKTFVEDIDQFVRKNHLPLVEFKKGERKDAIALAHLARFKSKEGVVFVGKAQEKAKVFRTTQGHNPKTGRTFPQITRSTAMVNHFYFYCLDKDFGPFFLKFCSYFPYNAKLCINGHEYAKRQLEKKGIRYKALDNGVLSCEDPEALQKICDDLSAPAIDALLRKWLARLPHPFTAKDREAGYQYDLSILQAEFSLTQVLDKPVTGRVFFEQVIRENLDLGRPDQVQLIFGRRVQKNTPGRFRTRVITENVIPSLHIDYKKSRIKQYHKEGQALRTETTINNTRDFAIGKRLKNLPALREIGFKANRRLLDVQRISHDCAIGEDAFHRVNQPVQLKTGRASALRFSDPRSQTLLNAMTVFRLQPRGFSNKTLREHLAPLRGQTPESISPGQMTYDLRRLRMHGLIERIPETHRYQVTDFGLRSSLFMTQAYSRLLRPGLSDLMEDALPHHGPLRQQFEQFNQAVNQWTQQSHFMN